MTRVGVLTPPGTGAIATVAVAGPAAWDVVRSRFRPAGGKPLPESPALHRFWFGTLGEGTADEVVVAVTAVEPELCVEVHCHGGRRVVRWVVEQFLADGCVEREGESPTKLTDSYPRALDARALTPLTQAPTLRTASILLDQYHGAFARGVADALAGLDLGEIAPLSALARFAPVGRHLVTPWRVAVAGPPNVGKSSLINALAGFQRSVVSPTPGTTRDVVTVPVALDGWPVALTDTAGLRSTDEALEAAGIGLARSVLGQSQVTLWVIDRTEPEPIYPDPDTASAVTHPMRNWILVLNKSDLPSNWNAESVLGGIPVSARTGEGLDQLIACMVFRLVPDPPPAGCAVPFTPALAELVERAHIAAVAGDLAAARAALAGCVG